METLTLVIDITSKRSVVSKYITDPLLLPPFTQGDVISGRISVVSETGDPTAPTTGVLVTGSSNIALTDGQSVTYAAATGINVQNSNDLVFNMDVESAALTAALTGDYISAFFEVRAAIGGVDTLIAREPVTITQAVTAPP